MAMLLDQRRSEILQLVEKNGFASLHELAERIGASESTIRRDLEYLNGIGHIRRTRGGAAFTGDSLTPFEERTSSALPQKQMIAEFAASLIQPGETVLLDGGTTTCEVARRLLGKSLQVVTNSLPIANLLVNQPDIELIMIGGYLYPRTGVALGPLAMQALAELHVPRLLMSVGGITEKGLFNSNTLLVDTERQMLRAATEVIVLTDSGKFGRSALAHLCDFEQIHHLITDDGITPEWRAIIEKSGVKLTVVSSNSSKHFD